MSKTRTRLIANTTNGNVYMHTIKGRPAMYDGNQLVHFNHWHRVGFEDVFVSSLEKIAHQQALSSEWRMKQGFDEKLRDDYSYIRIKL